MTRPGSLAPVMQVRVTPGEIQEQLAGTESVQRFVRGDVLDLAMYGSALLSMIVKDARALGAATFELECDNAGGVHTEMAVANGLTQRRELLKMWRALPVDERFELDTRAFRPRIDEDAWLEVNNRAFAWHPDQSGWTLDKLVAQQQESWFDPDGFLLHERDGRLAGFCWTKIHADERPPVGEIFVIAVDPDFHGQGLGRPLVLAGLHWLQAHDLRNAILYVEASNTPAVRLYEHLGFEVTEVHRWWSIDLREVTGADSSAEPTDDAGIADAS